MRGTPTYDLREIQRLIAAGPETRLVSKTATQGGAALGLDVLEILTVVLALDQRHFYKTMPANRAPGMWQDVYHVRWGSAEVYLKLQIGSGFAVVVQFKRK